MSRLAGSLAVLERNAERLRGEEGETGKQGRPGTTGKAGDPGLTWRGTFAYGTTYQPGDVVEWEGSSYVALVVTARRPPDPDWDLLAAKGEAGASGRGYIRGGGGSSGSALTVKDEGSSLTAAAASIDFAGAGVTASVVGTAVTVTVPGGGATPDLEAVLTAGNDGGGLNIVNLTDITGLPGTGAATGASISIPNASGTDGGEFEASGGNNDAGGTGASLELSPSNGDGEGGYGLLRGGDAVAGQLAGKATLQGGDTGGPSGATWEATGGNDTDPGYVVGSGRSLGFNAGGTPVGIELVGLIGNVGAPGTHAYLAGGAGDNGADIGAYIELEPGSGAGVHGRAKIRSNNLTGTAGQVLTAQGDGTALWAPFLAGSAQTYTESNVTTDRAFNANATSIDELADVLGTLIVDLRARGVVA